MILRLLESIYARTVARRRERCLHEVWHAPEEVKVISVGNLTMGGTGKTPAVQWLARELSAYGKVAVVGRGYRGSLSDKGAVASDGKSTFHNSVEVGDEALLHARALPGIPILIGRDRVQAVQMAIDQFQPQFIVLDDAFQYWSLGRDCDIVLLDAARPFDNQHTLPLGKLRELPEALERADITVLTRCGGQRPALLERSRRQISGYCEAPLFLSDHQPVDLRNETDGSAKDLKTLHGAKVLSVTAIANNNAWKQQLRELGAEVVTNLARRDHHHWQATELQNAVQRARNAGANMIITTEKDAVKIDPAWCHPLPLFSVRIDWHLENEAGFRQQLREQLKLL